MDFFRILNNFATILAWLVVLAVLWALLPYLGKLWILLQALHHFGC